MSRRQYFGIPGAGGGVSPIGQYDAAEGGYLFGYMEYSDGIYALYVAPKSAETSIVYITNRGYHTTAYRDKLDGRLNTDQYRAAAAAGNPQATTHCRLYTGGGKNDWYLPAEYEFNLLNRCFKPTTTVPTTLYGEVPNSIPPYGNAGVDPYGQTTFPEWQTGGAQALSSTGSYWVSNSQLSGGNSQTTMSPNTGNRGSGTVDFNQLVRPIRKKLIQLKSKQVVLGTSWAGGNINWTVPDGVTSISVLCVGCGFNGNTGASGNSGGVGGSGGFEGEIRYMNNISVTPGQVIACHVSQVPATPTSFGSIFSSASGGTAITPRYSSSAGGNGALRQGGAGGSGTSKVNLILPATARSLLNNGQPGNSSSFTPIGGLGGAGEWPGGAGGGGGGGGTSTAGGADLSGGGGGAGGKGAIRIIWPGTTRQYPSTGTEDQTV